MTRYLGIWRRFPVVMVPLILGFIPLLGWAHHDKWDYYYHDDEEEIPFDVAEIFFELNDTDGDLGIHALIDGEPWKKLEIEDPRGRRMLHISVQGRLRRQGLTEIFFESAEPNFEEFPPEDFFRRFPEGEYEVEGKTLEGDELESETEVTHVMPAPPDFAINDMPARPDSGECNEEVLPEVNNPVTISWSAVTESHPDIGKPDPDIEIIRYQVVAEWEDEDENVFVESVDIPPENCCSVTLSEDFFVDGTEVKFEVLAREASYNQTAVESCPFEFVADE